MWDDNAEMRRNVGAGSLFVLAAIVWARFVPHCWTMGELLSEPQIVVRGRVQDGSRVIIDDYREAYHWLRDHTPEDARVMAWWDYGYQINGVANRTTLADGNTWNHAPRASPPAPPSRASPPAPLRRALDAHAARALMPRCELPACAPVPHARTQNLSTAD